MKNLHEKLKALKAEIAKVIVGQEKTVDELLITFCAGGHALLEGVPGLAKTLMIKTLAQAASVNFNRIQFTPDLMPSDIVGTEILEEDHSTGKRFFKFEQGAMFTNILLADEINRTPPKTQSALLEAMQEYSVTSGGKTYDLSRPFFVLATQNPIEQAGTYPLPEAQLDRFLMYIKIGYPSKKEEIAILKQTTGAKKEAIQPVISGDDITLIQKHVRDVLISEELVEYVADLVRNTRPADSESRFVKDWVKWGAGPRAGQSMILCAKSRAFNQERYAVLPEDIQAVAHSVLRHRILLNFRAESEKITTDEVVTELIKQLKK